MNFISLDGGGSKLNAIWFDENMNLLGHARALGVNATITPKPEYMKQIRACFHELFADSAPTRIDRLYNICGNSHNYIEVLSSLASVEDVCQLGECVGGLLAGRCIQDGMTAIAGTGSNSLLHYKGLVDGNGGWGAILGDEGSGVWIARQAMQAVVRYECGWGEPTMLCEMVKEHLGLQKMYQLVRYLYDSPAPFQRLGTLLPLVGEAARKGDRVSIDAFTRGADMLAKQILALWNRHTDIDLDVITCGGAWKAWQGMFEEFTRKIHEERPNVHVYLPWFEHVLAGPAKLLLDMGLNADQARSALDKAYPQYEWRMNK